MPKRTDDYRSALLEDLKDPREAALYLTAALGETEEMFLVALRDVAEASQMANVAESAGIARESLYKMLRPSGNPTYHNLIGIFRALGVEFAQVRPRRTRTTPSPGPFTEYIPPEAVKKRQLPVRRDSAKKKRA